jgi:hypothetical protein
MQYAMERYSERHRIEALNELRSELRDFCYDGLVQLREDLLMQTVMRGSWSGCVISYKSGAAGSCRRDRFGRARNAFTVLWDNGWITDTEVRQLLDAELESREHAPAGRVPGSEVSLLAAGP